MKSKASRYTAAILAAGLALTGCKPQSSETEAVSADETGGRTMVDPSRITMADSYNFEKLTASNIEKTDCSITVECEDAPEAGGVVMLAEQPGCSGSGYASISTNADFKLTVDIPASQFYKLTVRHMAGSHKENPLLFNGAKVMNIYSEAGDWQESITLGKG